MECPMLEFLPDTYDLETKIILKLPRRGPTPHESEHSDASLQFEKPVFIISAKTKLGTGNDKTKLKVEVVFHQPHG